MRVRTTIFSDFTPGESRKKRTRSCSGSFGGWQVTSPPCDVGMRQVKTIRDVEVPRFHSLLRLGRFLPLNPCVIETVTQTIYQSGGDHDVYAKSCQNNGRVLTEHRGPDGKFTSQYFLPIPDVPEAVITAVVNAAVADSRSHIFDALTFLGEFAETQRMFKKNVGRLESMTNKLIARASRYRGPRSAKLQALAGLWLEARYGWGPLVYSLQDIRARLKGRALGLSKGRGFQTVAISDSDAYTISNSDSDISVLTTVHGSHTVRGWAASDVSNPFADSGVDPLATAYELTTLSFVLDWFVQYGTWIQAVSPFQAGKLLGACASIKTDVTRQASLDWSYKTDPAGNLHTGGGSRDFTEQVVRYTRFAASPDLPGWNPRITPKRFIDAIALAFGMRRRVSAAIMRL